MAKAATQTLSNSENAGNTLVRWNERARPRWATRLAGVPVMSLPSKMILPERRRKGAGEQVEERGLAGAVRPDDRVQAARLDGEADVLHRHEGAEGFAQALCLEDRHAKNRFQTSTTPPRKKSTTITNATPSSSGQRAHTTLIDSDSQMKTNEPMIGP